MRWASDSPVLLHCYPPCSASSPLRLFVSSSLRPNHTTNTALLIRGERKRRPSGQYLQKTPHPPPSIFSSKAAAANRSGTHDTWHTRSWSQLLDSARQAKHSRGSTMDLEMPGIEPGASRMQSERSTTELHPHNLQVAAHLPTPLTRLIPLLTHTTCLHCPL